MNKTFAYLALLLVPRMLMGQTVYDLLLKGGEVIDPQLHAQGRQQQRFAGPMGVGVESRSDFRQHRRKFVDRKIVDHQPRPGEQQPQGQAQAIEHDQQQPHVAAELNCGVLRQEKLHRPDDDKAGQRQAQSG